MTPHKTATNQLTFKLYIEELTQLRDTIADLRARSAGLEEQLAYYRQVCEEQALTIHIHEKGGSEQAATRRRLEKRIAELQVEAKLSRDALEDVRKYAMIDIEQSTEGIMTARIEVIARKALGDK